MPNPMAAAKLAAILATTSPVLNANADSLPTNAPRVERGVPHRWAQGANLSRIEAVESPATPTPVSSATGVKDPAVTSVERPSADEAPPLRVSMVAVGLIAILTAARTGGLDPLRKVRDLLDASAAELPVERVTALGNQIEQARGRGYFHEWRCATDVAKSIMSDSERAVFNDHLNSLRVAARYGLIGMGTLTGALAGTSIWAGLRLASVPQSLDMWAGGLALVGLAAGLKFANQFSKHVLSTGKD